MVDYISREEREELLKNHPSGQRSKGSNWRGRMERLKDGEGIMLYPGDDQHSHVLACTAYKAGRQAGIKVRTRKFEKDGRINLLIWMA